MPAAVFVVKATIAPEQEAAFNEWYDTVRSREAAQVPARKVLRRSLRRRLRCPSQALPWIQAPGKLLRQPASFAPVAEMAAAQEVQR